MKLKFLLSFLFLSILSCNLLAAPEEDMSALKKPFIKATNYMYDEDYEGALALLLSMDSISKDNANLKFQIGLCYSFMPKKTDLAIKYLEKAIQNITSNYKEGYYKEKQAPMETYTYLADAYHKSHAFDKAIENYNNYKVNLKVGDEELINEINRKIEISNNAKILVATPINMKIENAGPIINSKFPDYAPVLNVDESTMIFTSRRDSSTGGLINPQGQFFEDILISNKINGQWTEPVSIGSNINTDDHEASIGLSADGQELLIYKFENGSGDILSSKLMGNVWMTPQPIGSDVNTKAYESHASISADGNYLYFTSDREGGYGGLDIYYCKKLPDNSWSLAQNAGPIINTPYDDDSPFIHPDGVTLFFNSKGHNTMGEYDIFFSAKDKTGNWTAPLNMGYPVNTTGDDAFFVPTADGKRAFYASSKEDGYGDLDIYMLTFPERDETQLTIYSGIIKNKEGSVPEEVFITVIDNETGEDIGQYTPNAYTGKYIIVLTPGKDYNITYEGDGCFFKSVNINVSMDSGYNIINETVAFDPLEVGVVLPLNNLFYEFGTAKLTGKSDTELKSLKKLMDNCPSLKIELSGHTDSKGADAFNLKLSEKRVQSVVARLKTLGVDVSRVVAKGYGETKPLVPNLNEDGTDNLENMAKNRRTEFKVLEI